MQNENNYISLVILSGILAMAFAFWKASWINKQNSFNPEKSNRGNIRSKNSTRRSNYQNTGFETFKFNFGRNNNIRVGNIISTICNATNLNGKVIGKIQIFNDYSLVDLPKDLKKETKNQLKNLRIRN